MVPFHVVD